MTDAYSNDAATSTGTIADTTNNAASGAPQRAESTERLARPLIKLAKACGLATSFIDQLGTYTEISDAALVAVLKALDVDASSDEAIVRSMTQLEVENSKRLLPSTIVATTGKPTGITLNCSSDADITASIELEDGTMTLPAELKILKGAGPEEDAQEVLVTIREGKFHQIKRMFEALGCRVEYLKRISMGPLILDPNLEPGEYRPLTLQEEASIKDCGNRGNRV